MNFASLFSGIGGADIAAVKAGWNHKFWCEIDPFCQRILKYWFEKSEGYGDIKGTDFGFWNGKIDVLHGSAPCQAVSISGKRKGDSDDRWLWNEMLRAIREIKPCWVTFENVANLKSMVSSSTASYMEDGVCYEGKEGLLYGIIRDLEAEGYTVEAFIIPACAAGAPHLRKRIWITGYLADAINARNEILEGGEAEILSSRTSSKPSSERRLDRGHHIEGRQIHTEPKRDLEENKPERRERIGWSGQDGKDGVPSFAAVGQEERYGIGGTKGNYWGGFPTQSPVCRGNDGIPFDVDSLAIPFGKWRKESLKAYGNALVPQVIYEIFNAINEIENESKRTDK